MHFISPKTRTDAIHSEPQEPLISFIERSHSLYRQLSLNSSCQDEYHTYRCTVLYTFPRNHLPRLHGRMQKLQLCEVLQKLLDRPGYKLPVFYAAKESPLCTSIQPAGLKPEFIPGVTEGQFCFHNL